MEDIEIVKSVQAGNSELFSLLVEKYHKHLLNFIYRLVGDRQIVEDIGQEVFLGIYKSIRAFNTGRGVPFSAWLFITARNRCISELRKRRRPVLFVEATAILPAKGKTPEQITGEEETLSAIHAALQQIPAPYRQTLMQSLQGATPEEIAHDNRISRGTVKSRLFRARNKMKLLLQDRWGGNHYGRL